MPKFALTIAAVLLCCLRAMAQGETTSAIAGSVADPAGSAIPGAIVTIVSSENGMKRTVRTDEAGRYAFPQLKPGIYSVKAEADRFETQENRAVTAGLGVKQTVDFKLPIASASESIVVHEQAPQLNPENPNSSTTLAAAALENLPNPGGDMTYPLQFAAGALINTAGSGNDFVGGSNGYGNVQFNGLPSLSNGYIVDGLETNDPLTNLNSGLSTNLVLGLNNWQRFETPNGLRWYTVFRSLVASCKLHDLCPQRYLECVLRLAPHWPMQRMLELAPSYWRETAARLTPEQQATVRPSWSAAFDAFAPPSEPAATSKAA